MLQPQIGGFMAKKLLLIALLLSQVSCMTMKLWDKTYDETFSNFSVSPKGDRIALIGDRYHYVFTDNSGLLKDLFMWRDSHLLFIDVKKTLLQVDLQDQVSGHITFESFSDNIRPDQKMLLLASGYTSNNGDPLSKTITVSGSRFLPPQALEGVTPPLDRTYAVSIHYAATPAQRTTDIILTPFALVADVAVLVGKFLLLPFHGQ